MEIYRNPDRKSWEEIIKRPVFSHVELEERVKPVMEAIRLEGDAAVKRYTKQFDGVEISDIQVSKSELRMASREVSDDLKSAIQLAYENIKTFHAAQREPERPVETVPGVMCWRKSIPLEKVGLYIPGGSAPLFSTVLMLGIPARLAECGEVILCSPPSKEGKIHPVVLYVADLLSIHKVYKVGGAQAIAAMGYGTKSIPKVDKVFGPGNQYVTVAKQLINQQGTAIDMPAGPSEVAILADRTARIPFLAADLLSQAEHGPDSQVLLVTDDGQILDKVKLEIEEQLAHLPRKGFAKQSLEKSKFVLVKNLVEGIELINKYAPEHLILQVQNYEVLMEKIQHAGSVFLGNYTPEAAGDYASGTNHTLPTNGYARIYSGVSLDSFVRKVTFQEISPLGLKTIGPAIEKMAEAECLQAHKNAVSVRLREIGG